MIITKEMSQAVCDQLPKKVAIATSFQKRTVGRQLPGTEFRRMDSIPLVLAGWEEHSG